MQRLLLKEGKQVCVVDRASRYDVLKNNLLAHPTYVEYVPFDLASGDESSGRRINTNGLNGGMGNASNELRRAVLGADTVYSMVTPDVQQGTVRDMKRTNVEGVMRIIDACNDAGVSKLVYMSSIGVTGQHIPSVEQTEEHPLPDHDDYDNAYDLTKRLGEDAILEASSSSLRTCAIRAGGIIAGANDYIFRRISDTPGVVYAVDRSPMDVVSAKDLSRALFKASKKLGESDSAVAGRSLFVTKCRSNSPVSLSEMYETLGELLGWRVVKVPSPVLSIVQAGLWSMETAGKFMGNIEDEDSKVALPMQKMIQTGRCQQSFDNSLARSLLDFEPEESWNDALQWVARDIQLRNPDLFEAKPVSRGVLQRVPV